MRLTANEVAKAVGVGIQAIHRARQRGQLKAERTGRRHWYYTPEAVTAWLKTRRTPPRLPSEQDP